VTDTPVPTATQAPTATPEPTTTPAGVGGGSGQLAFADFVDDVPQVFIMNLDGSNRQQITEISDGACQPDWSPDGTQIVFVSPCQKSEHYYNVYEEASLYVMSADGSDPEKLPMMEVEGAGDFDPAWSPDGSRIAFASSGRVKVDVLPHLYVYDLDKGTLIELISNIPARGPSWSPDSTQLVFEMSRGQVWILNADGSGSETIFSTSQLVSFSPGWSPDGELIIFGQQNTPMLVGKTVSDRVQSAEPYDSVIAMRPAWEPEFSPDGEWVLFNHADKEIILFKVTGSELDVESLGPGFHPDWRP
jgi:Tol biopolymer transport system component